MQLTLDENRAGVSVDLNVSFCAAAQAGSELQVEGRVLKMGRKLAFTEVEITDKESGKLIATGRHTKAL